MAAQSNPIRLPLRPELVTVAPYGAPEVTVRARLNVNENPYPVPPAVAEHLGREITRLAGGLNRYPDREFFELRDGLASYLARESGGTFLTAANIWAANGSNEVMAHLFSAFGGPGRTALSFDPSYSMYPEYARTSHTRLYCAGRESDFTIDIERALAAIASEQPTLIVLASPNNPTGTVLPLETVAAICEATWAQGEARAVVVVDEAYAEFRRPGRPSAISLLPRYGHLAVSRTMSKAFALAGARLGYLAAAPELTQALRTVRLPYHLSCLTQAAGLVALAHADELMAGVDRLRRARDELVLWLRDRTAGGAALHVPDTDANFVFFGVVPDANAIAAQMMEHSVLIRPSALPGWLRVTVGTEAELELFRQAFVEVVRP